MVNYKKGQVWNKPKTVLMNQFEKEKNKNAIHNGKITGQFEYWQWQQEKKSKLKSTSKPKPKPKAKPKPDSVKNSFETNKKILYNIFYKNNSKPLTTDEIKKLSNNQINTPILKHLKLLGWVNRKKYKDKKFRWSPSGLWYIKPKTKAKPKIDVERYWNRLPHNRRKMFLTDLGYGESYVISNYKQRWIHLPNTIQNQIKQEKNVRVLKEIYNLSNTEFDDIYEEYKEDKFDPEEIENGDYVDFGTYGNLYVVHRRDDRNFWVTDLKHERYNDNAPGWIIRINQAERIIRK